MTTSYPGANDALTNPTSGQFLSSPSHSAQHANANDAIEALQAYPMRVHDAKAYGAVGNGSTDDTTALQNWLNASTSGTPLALYLPPGTYKITDDLVLPFAPRTRIFGAGRGQSKIVQYTAGKSVLWFKTDLTHTITVEDVWLTYNAPQTNSASVAVRFEPASSSADYFALVFERVIVENAYDGFKITNGLTGATAKTVWETVFRDIQMYAIKHSAVDFYNTNIGVPVVRFENFGVFNTNTAVVATGSMFKFTAVETSAVMMDLEGWYNQLFYAEGGAVHRWESVHIENNFTTTSSPLVELANSGGFFARSWQIYEVQTPTTSLGAVSIFHGYESDALFDVDQVIASMVVSSGTTRQLFGQSGTGKPKFRLGYFKDYGTGNISVPSADTTAIAYTLRDDPMTGVRTLWNNVSIRSGSGSPESSITAPVGSLYLRTDGSTSTTLYVKTSGTGNTGWTGK